MKNTVTRRRMKEEAKRAAVKGAEGIDVWGGCGGGRNFPGDMTSEIKDGKKKEG